MKKIIEIFTLLTWKTGFLILVIISFSVNAQPPGEWMWIHGDSGSIYRPGNFGVMGVTSPFNDPPALYEPIEWKDLNGNFWFFGGGGVNGACGALWKYEPSINQWTWMKGDSIPNAPGHYGTQGISSAANTPPARTLGGVSWTDLFGNLWLYGGFQIGMGIGFSDLWKYDIQSNEWTWVQGDSSGYIFPVYGTQGLPDINNTPGGRIEIATGWTDNAGDLWLFGGQQNNVARNDLWRYNIAINMWTWMKGPQTANDLGNYGTQGVEDPLNLPPARWSWTHWEDLNGNLWLFGGRTMNTGDMYSDLWRYNPATNNWTWMHGDNFTNSIGIYTLTCATSTANKPRSRFENRACITDEFGNFWMYGGGPGLNDLWMYCVSSNEWTFINGSAAYLPPDWGSLNVPAPSNHPGGRLGNAAWYDNARHIYLFGAAMTGQNDLWRYTLPEMCGSYCAPLSTDIPTDELISGVEVYPNPFTNTLTVKWNDNQNEKEIILYDITGREILRRETSETIINFNTEKFSAGFYLLNYNTANIKLVKF